MDQAKDILDEVDGDAFIWVEVSHVKAVTGAPRMECVDSKT